MCTVLCWLLDAEPTFFSLGSALLLREAFRREYSRMRVWDMDMGGMSVS
jgi:hypothetical protein